MSGGRMKTALGLVRFIVAVAVCLAFAALAIVTLPIDYRRGRFFHRIARLWARTLLWVSGVTLRVRGRENLQAGCAYIYVANHASLLDIPCAVAGIPDYFRFVYKKELEAIPLFGWALKWGNHIPIEREHRHGSVRSLEETARKIHQGASVLFYPEGTRTRDGKLQPFKRGAFQLALRAGIPVVPLTINGTFAILRRGSMVVHPSRVELVLGVPIPVCGTGKQVELTLMAQVHAAVRQAYVDQQLTPQGTMP